MGTGSSKIGNPSNGTIKFTSTNDMIDFIVDEYSDWYDNLSDTEKMYVADYAAVSAQINNALNNGTDVNMDYVDAMDSAVAAHSLSKSVTVYKGVGTNFLGIDLSSEEAIKNAIGKSVTDKGFMSTSVDERVGQIYNRGVVIKMDLPKGTKAAGVDLGASDIKGNLSTVREYGKAGDLNMELTLGRGTKVTFTGYKKKKDLYGNEYFEISAKYMR